MRTSATVATVAAVAAVAAVATVLTTASALAMPASQSADGTVTVVVEGLRNSEGQLGLLIFDERGGAGFPARSERAVRRVMLPLRARRATHTFTGLPHGAYAVAVVHDENASGGLDRGLLGRPREGIGASNNPRSRFGPPSFGDARFLVERREVTLRVRVVYP